MSKRTLVATIGAVITAAVMLLNIYQGVSPDEAAERAAKVGSAAENIAGELIPSDTPAPSSSATPTPTEGHDGGATD